MSSTDSLYVNISAEQPHTPLSEEDQKLLQGNTPESKGIWIIWTLTGEEQYEPAEAKVSLEICGTNGCSKPIPLSKEKDRTNCLFETGALDQFQVRFINFVLVAVVHLTYLVCIYGWENPTRN